MVEDRKIKKKKLRNKLLDHVSAMARHRELLAILSRSSKTTLLDAIVGRIDKKGLGESICVKGKPKGSKFKRI